MRARLWKLCFEAWTYCMAYDWPGARPLIVIMTLLDSERTSKMLNRTKMFIDAILARRR